MVEFETDTPEGLRAFLAGDGTGDVPCKVGVSGGVWDDAPDFFEELARESPNVRISAGRDPARAAENVTTDKWGCVWHFPGQYLDGQVIGHPLAAWDAYGDWQVPDPASYLDWDALKAGLARDRAIGRTAWGYVEHGFLYLRMTYLRGFDNFMIDVAEHSDRLWELCGRIADFWVDAVDRFIAAGADAISFGDDLGHQNTLPMSPTVWRDLLKDAYRRIYARCRDAGVPVYMHTDGWILDIIPDLLEVGVDILNPQDLVNGLDNLKRLVKGAAAIDLDIDRQSVTVFGKPAEIDAHIRKCIETLGPPAGGLILTYGVYAGTPLANVAACVRAMQKYHDLWMR
jgi:hypothetical protein